MSMTDLFNQAQQHIPGGVNSPVRAFKGVGGDPVFVSRAAGAYIWDVSIALLIVSVMGIAALRMVFTPALQSTVPVLVPDRDAMQAINGLFDATWRLARLIGPALAAVLNAFLPVIHFLSVTAVGFILSGMAIWAVRDRLITNLEAPVGLQVKDGGYDARQNARITWQNHLQQATEWEGEMWGKKHDFVGTIAFGDGERKPRELQEPGTYYEYNDVRINRFALSMLLPHMGFAFSQIGQYDKAIEAFTEVRKLSPHDPAVNGYLISAQLAAKRFDEAADTARAARADRPDDIRFVRLEAQALLQGGHADQALALVEGVASKRANDPQAQIVLAQLYADANRGAQAIKVLQTAQTRFPANTSVGFELGAALEKQKRFADAEAAFRSVIARDPSHAAALNYLGYMLAERGERLGESLDLIKRALAVEPDNGSYLDSLGWAYFKDGQLGPAEEHLKRAADQLMTNSVVQDHYGDVLLRLGRFQAAIDAWSRALAGDGDSIDRGDVGDKIRSARQKLPR